MDVEIRTEAVQFPEKEYINGISLQCTQSWPGTFYIDDLPPNWPSVIHLKGVWHENFDFKFFSWICVPQAPKYSIGAFLNLFENSWRYSQMAIRDSCQY
jgi:hypothetical protein